MAGTMQWNLASYEYQGYSSEGRWVSVDGDIAAEAIERMGLEEALNPNNWVDLGDEDGVSVGKPDYTRSDAYEAELRAKWGTENA